MAGYVGTFCSSAGIAPSHAVHPLHPAAPPSIKARTSCQSLRTRSGLLKAVSGGSGLVCGFIAAHSARNRRRLESVSPAVPRIIRHDVAKHVESATQTLADTADKCLLNNYGKRNVVFTRGLGHYLYDENDKEYLDFTAGIAVNCLGHSDPGWAEAVSRQASTLVHTSNLWLNVEQVALGEKLTHFSFADKAFFCNSGTEANEAAIKFSRKFHVAADQPREEFVAFENAFHGRTMGALALTWKQGYKEPFQPLMPSTSFLPFNDTAALNAITTKTCAVFIEPMQGEGGCVPGEADFMKALRHRCDEVGALLVFDEVQCGLGRTGHLFAYQLSGVIPDLVTLAKPLAGGLPIGAVLMSDKVAKCISPGDHGSTFAGAPLVCAAANYTFDRVSQPAFLKNVQEMGTRLRSGLKKMVEPHDLPVRGEGLLVGIVFPDATSCSAVQKAATENGLLVLTAGAGNVLRIAPALTVTAADVDLALERLQAAFRASM